MGLFWGYVAESAWDSRTSAIRNLHLCVRTNLSYRQIGACGLRKSRHLQLAQLFNPENRPLRKSCGIAETFIGNSALDTHYKLLGTEAKLDSKPEKRDQQIVALITKSERQWLEQFSRKVDRSLSDTIRQLVREKSLANSR